MGYHTFDESGHFCPKCDNGPFTCMMEDGQCDNAGLCNSCIKTQFADVDPEEPEYREQMQERYDNEFGTPY